jgi:hypothetical protein
VRERVLALIRCELQSIMGGSGEAMAVLVYEWRSLSGKARPGCWRCVMSTKRSGCKCWARPSSPAISGRCVYHPTLSHRRTVLDHHLVPRRGSLSLDQLAEQALLMVLKAD